MTAPHCPGEGRYFPLSPENILALCDSAIRINAAENRSTTTDLSVIYNHKPPEIRNAIVVVDHEWCPGLDCKSAGLVSFQLFAPVALRLQCRRIHDSLDCHDLPFHVLTSTPQPLQTPN